MSARYHDVETVATEAGLSVRFRIENRSGETWRSSAGFAIGWQIYDPQTALFISEGEWAPLAADVAPGERSTIELHVALPPEPGHYRVYASPLDKTGWRYLQGWRFLVIDALVEDGRARLVDASDTTLSRLRWRNLGPAARKLLVSPAETLWRNRSLIRSMARRDILARYRGSFGDVLWTVLNPLLLMATYFFVFGVVLQTRFAADPTRAGFSLYFLAGMLPWLAFSEPIARAPQIVLEHRNFVKKLVFPLETLPVAPVAAGLVTQTLATALFLIALVAARGGVPWSIVWLPALVVPQVLFTLGLSWFLAGLGAYVRDLSQIMGFLLTIWFFLTPICYPEASLPASLAPLLSKNPIYALVRSYRAILLEGHAPAISTMVKLYVFSAAVFLLGHSWFYKLRKTFADVV
jgi:lipopolysaccharide transport system permease protein